MASQSRPPVPRPSPSGKARGGKERSRDDPDVRMSKSLSWILRHGAEKEGLAMRQDGYVKVDDLLRHAKFRNLTFDQLKNIVITNDKKRYRLRFEPEDAAATPLELPKPEEDMAPAAELQEVSATQQSGAAGTWWIRANQGHTQKVDDLELVEITSAAQIPMAVHGTSQTAWATIKNEGLSKMKRNHIHLAQGLPNTGVISGMRSTSAILIYINVGKALAAGIKFYVSANGVVLTAGDERGYLSTQYFEKVVDQKGAAVTGWETSDP